MGTSGALSFIIIYEKLRAAGGIVKWPAPEPRGLSVRRELAAPFRRTNRSLTLAS